MSYDFQALKEIPNIISPQDRNRLMLANTLNMQPRVLLYEEMIDRYSDSHPFLLVRLADLFVLLGSGIVDTGLDNLVERYGLQVDHQVNDILAMARESTYYQKWKLTKEHIFPTNLPHLPSEFQDVKDQWQELIPQGSTFFETYLKKLAIETNHVESTFLLTEGSTQDLVRHGISEGIVDYLPESSLKDSAKIKSILNDTLAAYERLSELCDNLEGLDKATICRIHSRLMKTCQFSDFHYIPAGKMRTETRKTVIVTGAYQIECCPFPEVDGELEYICKMAKQWIKSWRNPFATASWIHLVLVRCHPFEDGNGRLVRLLASIPLMRHGYPPISVSLSQRGSYYAAINEAYEGNHSALTQCMLKGMKETIASVQSL